MENVDPGQIVQKQLVTATEFASRFRSKGEVYLSLTLEVDVYLPSKDACSIFWLKDIIFGKKKVRNCFCS